MVLRLFLKITLVFAFFREIDCQAAADKLSEMLEKVRMMRQLEDNDDDDMMEERKIL